MATPVLNKENRPHAAPDRSTDPYRQAGGEAGYILLGVLVLIAIFALMLAVAAPIVAKDIERDKEVEAVHRGQQYKHAIKMYYKKFGAYPVSMKQLEETNNIRFLRKRYLDPITGKDDWRLIHVGEAKVPVMGFFGQPLQAGMSSATTGLAGNGTGGIGGAPGSTGIGGSSSAGGSSSFGNSSFGASTFGSSSTGSGSSTGGTDATAAPAGVLPGMSSAGGGASATAGANGAAGTNAPGSTSGFNGSTTTGSGGSGFDAGGPIVGVGIPGTKKSLVVYKKQDTFNKWEFTYDPIEDQMTVSSSGIPGATGAGTNAGANTGFGSSTGGSNNGFGSTTGGFGSTTSGFTNGSTGSSTPGILPGPPSGSSPGSTSGPTPQN